MDVIPGLSHILDDPDPMLDDSERQQALSENPVGTGSRFSQFFSKVKQEEQPQKEMNQRPALIAETEEEKNFFQELIRGAGGQPDHQEGQGDKKQTSIKIPSPGDPSAYFAPISPAEKTENPVIATVNPIMEMLRQGGKSKQNPSLKSFMKLLLIFKFSHS